jgi:hypothetical protein
VVIQRTFVDEKEIKRRVDEIRAELGPDVVSLEYRLGEDWTGDPAIFFGIVTTDEAARPPRLRETTRPINDALRIKLDPFGSWGLLPYTSFRSESENRVLKNEAWP